MKPTKAPPTRLSPELVRLVTQVARAVRKRHPFEVADRAKAEKVARLFKAALCPRHWSGRPTTKRVAEAVALRDQGKQWPQIYPAVIADYRNLPAHERRYEAEKLRHAVGASRTRRAHPYRRNPSR